ncbi:MAG: DUF4919 domain-containing protein [Chitinophagaceae bacterium]|jgi:hypothetical protein|nr:DUF4919 domain-containing protein [Chitinophagaceae bacterium]
MKKSFLLSIGVLSFIFVSAQNPIKEKPDYKEIESEITNKDSKFYYPKLMERYNAFDTTLSTEEYKYLYYGVLFQRSYSPYGKSIYTDTLNNLLKDKQSFSTSDYNNIIKYETLILKEFPFNLRNLLMLAFAYEENGIVDSLMFVNFKLKNVAKTILSTGDGKTESTAWHVISIEHEYDLLSLLGYKFGGSQSLTKKGCDYLTVQKNDENIAGFYFDVNMILKAEAKLYN